MAVHLMCQVATPSMMGGAEFPCENRASGVLVGIHMCGTHRRTWEPKVKAGRKVRIHPSRTLPLDHVCPGMQQQEKPAVAPDGRLDEVQPYEVVRARSDLEAYFRAQPRAREDTQAIEDLQRAAVSDLDWSRTRSRPRRAWGAT